MRDVWNNKFLMTGVMLLVLAALSSSHAAGVKRNQLLEQEITSLKENLTAVWETMMELRNQVEYLENEGKVRHHHHHYHHHYPNSNSNNSNSTDWTDEDSANHTDNLDHDHTFEHEFSYLIDPHNASAGQHYHHHHHLRHHHSRTEENTQMINNHRNNHHHNANGNNHNHNSNGNHNHNSNGNHNGNHNGNGNDEEPLFSKAIGDDIIAQATCQIRVNRALPTNERHALRGSAHFKQKAGLLEIDLNIRGFIIAQHASPDHEEHPHEHEHEYVHSLHVHEFGDLSNGCESAGGHYNPLGEVHGAPNSTRRHVGDLGNIRCDEHGTVITKINDTLASLIGTHSIIGKTLVVHEGMDDYGSNPDDEGSMTTGNTGKRLGCCVITALGDGNKG